MWIPILAFEVLLVLLAACKLVPYFNKMNKTIIVLARDSIVYFLVVGVCLVGDSASQVDMKTHIVFGNPGMLIASIAVGRMMMNLRGLVMEDVGHAGGHSGGFADHQQTLRFNTRSTSSTKIGEAV